MAEVQRERSGEVAVERSQCTEYKSIDVLNVDPEIRSIPGWSVCEWCEIISVLDSCVVIPSIGIARIRATPRGQ